MSFILFEKKDFETLLHELQEIKKLLHGSQKKQALNEYVNTDEAAKLLKVTPRTLQNWRDQKLISFIQIGSKILFRHEDIDAFLISHRINRKEG